MDGPTSPAPVIIVFGITGDLSRRKLLPALYHLLSQDILPKGTKILGISRREQNAQEFLRTVELCVLEHDNVCDPEGLKRVGEALDMLRLDPKNPVDYDKLKAKLNSYDAAGPRDRIFYMSIPSSAYAPIVEQLAHNGLNDDRSRLLVEKPFGYDIESARQLLGLTRNAFDEQHIFRIDHYLAKETAQNLLAFRLHNPIFLPLWKSEHIVSIHVRAFESIGIEGRASFYEQTGALRDLIQSHLMQLLAITMMDVPPDLTSEAIHRSKQYFLEQLEPAKPQEAKRAQYNGYRDEVENPNSTVETYAKVELHHAAIRWQDTRIILETGKGLAEKVTDITITFKSLHERRHNTLTFRIQPNEGISLDLLVKQPGYENRMAHSSLEFDYKSAFDQPQIDAYERVFMDAVRGDQTLFASDDEVMATWRVLQPVLDAWKDNDTGLKHYEQGADDPEA